MSNVIPSAADALAAWAERVKGNRDQAEHFREGGPPQDFYAPVASAFRADPRRTDEAALDLLRGLVEPGDTWLDIGAGGGRYALALALKAQRVIAVEPSPGMREVLRAGMAEHGITNVEIIESTWPMASGAPEADVAFISHVGYDIEDIGPFVDAMERSARRLCVALLLSRAPASFAEPYWPAIHGEPRVPLPALREFVTLLLARGRFVEIRRAGVRGLGSYDDIEAARRALRMQLFIQPDGEKDRKLTALLEAAATEDGIRLAGEPMQLGVVTWEPR